MIYKLYDSCVPVKGAFKSIICDLQNIKYYNITNDLCDLLIENDSMDFDKIAREYDEENKQILAEYFEFLLSSNLVFECEKSDLPLFSTREETEWIMPYLVSNVIIDSDETSNHNYEKIFTSLNNLNCPHIQLRFYYSVSLDEINIIASHLSEKCFKSVELILPYNESINGYFDLTRSEPRIKVVTFYGSPKHEICRSNDTLACMIFFKEEIVSEKNCGVVHPSYFSINNQMFIEAQTYNSCLNGKVSIDVKGNIKNCPSMDKSFGNISTDNLATVVMELEFQKLWRLNKNSISICKDCEFRYICADCRAYIAEPENIFSKPLKCNYDPYSGEWKK